MIVMSMGKLKTIAIAVGALLLGGGGFLAVTNPTPEVYEEFAVDRLEEYARQELCEGNDSGGGGLSGLLSGSCDSLVSLGREPARQLVIRQTERQNYGLFSIYISDLNANEYLPVDLIGKRLPTFHVESVGIAGQFIIYNFKEK